MKEGQKVNLTYSLKYKKNQVNQKGNMSAIYKERVHVFF